MSTLGLELHAGDRVTVVAYGHDGVATIRAEVQKQIVGTYWTSWGARGLLDPAKRGTQWILGWPPRDSEEVQALLAAASLVRE